MVSQKCDKIVTTEFGKFAIIVSSSEQKEAIMARTRRIKNEGDGEKEGVSPAKAFLSLGGD